MLLSLAVAVQIVVRVHGEVVEVEHIGSAHSDAELAVLLAAARERLHPGQGELDLGPLPEAVVSTEDVADWTRSSEDVLALSVGVERSPGRPAVVAGGGRVVATASLLLWEVSQSGAEQERYAGASVRAHRCCTSVPLIVIRQDPGGSAVDTRGCPERASVAPETTALIQDMPDEKALPGNMSK